MSYSGEGQALILKEKCSSLKTFTASSSFIFYDNQLAKINYENSILGKKILSSVYNESDYDNLIASDGLLDYKMYPYSYNGIFYLEIYIAGVQKGYKYSSSELQIFDPSSTSTAANNYFKSKAKSADEFHKLLESNLDLKKIYLKLK
jgi:hypothetical protein